MHKSTSFLSEMRQIEATKPGVYYRWKNKMLWRLETLTAGMLLLMPELGGCTMSLVGRCKVQ